MKLTREGDVGEGKLMKEIILRRKRERKGGGEGHFEYFKIIKKCVKKKMKTTKRKCLIQPIPQSPITEMSTYSVSHKY